MNNEELQSRREFFKKAAKVALPVVAAVALASAPAIVNAAEVNMGCESCLGNCSGGCKNTCSGSCSCGCTGCRNSCVGSCSCTSRK